MFFASTGPGRRPVGPRLHARQHDVAAERIRQFDQLGRRPRVQPQTIGNAKCDSSHLIHCSLFITHCSFCH